MANLLGQNIGTNYKGILSLDSTINTPLDATLRAVTDGEGNASGLKLSTSDSSFNGKLGIGTDAPTKELTIDANSTDGGLIIRSQNDSTLFQVTKDGTSANTCELFQYSGGAVNFAIRSASNASFFNNGTFTFGATTNLGAKLNIKGSGTTSATTSLLVQNSAGTELLKVTDDSVTNARGNFNVLHPSVATRSLKLGWGSIFATDSGSELTLGAVFAVPSSPQILLAGNTRSSGANTMQLQASLGVSIAASLINPSAQLHVKGIGTTLATTAFLVQNSAGTAALTVRDDLSTSVKNLTIDNAMYGSSSGRMNIIPQYDLAIRPNVGGVGFAEGFGFSVNGSALIEMQSTTKGFLPPRMTTTQKNAISSPASGLVVYDTDTNKLACYNGTTWNDLF